MSVIRSRWAAVGAAIAVSLGAGGIGIGHAVTDSGDRPVFIPIEPCRLADTRPGSIGPDSSLSFDGWGTSGGCSLPSGIAALALNVAAVDATQQTNLRFYPDGSAVPDTANLNPRPGAPPTPNAVNVTLSETDGKFAVYNRFGSVAVVIDVMGYYDHHTHDDLYYRESEVDAALDNVEAVDSDALGGFPAVRYPRFTAVIRMRSGSDGYVVEQGTDPGLTVDAVSSSVLVIGELGSPARSLMESANCTSGFSGLQMFTVYKSAVSGVTPTRAELHLIQPDGTPLSFNGRSVYCTIWE